MKNAGKFVLLFLFSFMVIGYLGCQNTRQSDENTSQDSSLLIDSIPAVEQELTLPYQILYNEKTERFEIKDNTDSNNIARTPEDLAKTLNRKYPDIQLIVKERSGDTLTVSIPEATSLTQTSGTAGAMVYLAETTYSFTSIDSIEVVNFSFKEGDHAVPGPYTRDSFNEFL